MLNLELQNLEATISQQQNQIEILTAQIKEQIAQIQKVNARLEMNKPAAQNDCEQTQSCSLSEIHGKLKNETKQKMKNRSTILLAILPVLACFTLLPGARAVTPPPDGCYPNFTTAEGCDALSSLTTGAGNTGLGWRALFTDSTGNFNTGVGVGALVLNNADSNTAVGAAALLLNTSGTQNTAVGAAALVFNSSGNSNTATGYSALMNNTSGGANTAIGWEALTANTIGVNNVALALFPSQATPMEATTRPSVIWRSRTA